MKILVTSAWRATPEEFRRLREMGHQIFFQQQENTALKCPAEEVEAVICNALFLSHPIEQFSHLRYIQLTSAGFDRVPQEYIHTHGMEIHNARGVYSIPMAEHALAGVLALYRHLNEFRSFQHQAKWEKLRNLEELFGRDILIVGCGSVGTETAHRFAAFGCRVTGIDLVSRREVSPFQEILTLEHLDQKLPQTDILILTVPLTEDTHRLLDARRLSMLAAGAVVVNISRGGVVDQEALTGELISGRLRAVLDVFEEEPLAGDNPLWQLENVLLTPHNSFVGNGNATRLSELIFHNLRYFNAL